MEVVDGGAFFEFVFWRDTQLVVLVLFGWL
jgi:hypothetical protein